MPALLYLPRCNLSNENDSLKARMTPPRVQRQVLGTSNSPQISFSGPDLLLRRQRGFVFPIHASTKLGLTSVEFPPLGLQQTILAILNDPGSSRLHPCCLSTGCVDLSEFLASQRPFQRAVLRALLPLIQDVGC